MGDSIEVNDSMKLGSRSQKIGVGDAVTQVMEGGISPSELNDGQTVAGQDQRLIVAAIQVLQDKLAVSASLDHYNPRDLFAGLTDTVKRDNDMESIVEIDHQEPKVSVKFPHREHSKSKGVER